MKVPLSWLQELVDIRVDVAVLAERLSRTGTSVESVEQTGGGVAGVVVAQVLEVSDVAESSKLCVAQLDAGPHGTFQIVAGARNFKAGDKIPLAKPGSRVTTIPEVGVRKMVQGRYESQGMACSAHELGISEDHSGILVLDAGAELGADVAEMLAIDDHVLTFEIYPNRPDCLSVLGIAREAALVFDAALRVPDTSVVEQGGPCADLTSVTVEDASGCPRYLARVVEGVRFQPSPPLVQARLSKCGFRPLGNLVDATNYVLLLLGQPLHAFDLDRLTGQSVVVRRARPGERMATLDEAERALDPADLVIADARSPQALAGVMGSADSEVSQTTTRVLVESAFFDPLSVARTARLHKMRTEASSRFQDGTDPEMVPRAAALCAELLRRWAGGTVARGAVDVGGAPPRRSVTLRSARAEAVLGIPVAADEVGRHLRGLGCEVSGTNGVTNVVVPSWRPDLEREIDVIEELARLHGYDNFPMVMPAGQRGLLTPAQMYRRRVRQVLLGAGLHEATVLSFVSTDELALIGSPPAVAVTNPMTIDQAHLRPSLLPGLLRAAAHNSAHGVGDVGLFEVGTAFVGWEPADQLPTEQTRVAAILAGHVGSDVWYSRARPVDGFDAKGIVELVCAELGVTGWQTAPCERMPMHPGRSSTVVLGGDEVGLFGEVRPSVAESLDLPGGVAVVELDLGALLRHAQTTLTIRELARFPAIARDVSVVVDAATPAARVQEVVARAAGEHLESVVCLDDYRGDPVPEGRRSLSFRLTLRAGDRTLHSQEADEARERAVDALRETLGGDIR